MGLVGGKGHLRSRRVGNLWYGMKIGFFPICMLFWIGSINHI